MRVGQARKRDTTEAQIVRALQQIGAAVIKLSEPGAPDLLVLWRGKLSLLEAKSWRGGATAAQVKRSREGWPVLTVRSSLEALEAIGASGKDLP